MCVQGRQRWATAPLQLASTGIIKRHTALNHARPNPLRSMALPSAFVKSSVSVVERYRSSPALRPLSPPTSTTLPASTHRDVTCRAQRFVSSGQRAERSREVFEWGGQGG